MALPRDEALIAVFHSYSPADGHGLRHDPLSSLVAPRPIGWVSTVDAAGRRNLAPYSFFTVFNYRPPIVGFSSVGWKDSVANVAAGGEFVWNLATLPLIDQVNATSVAETADVDEFDVAGLGTIDSSRVAPPRVAEADAAFECRASDVHRLRRADGTDVDTWLVLGEVVFVHIRSTLVTDGEFRTTSVEPLLRGGGPGDYFTVHDRDRRVLLRPLDPKTRVRP